MRPGLAAHATALITWDVDVDVDLTVRRGAGFAFEQRSTTVATGA
jgi:hypothetical protein